jgi:hypothetical protein
LDEVGEYTFDRVLPGDGEHDILEGLWFHNATIHEIS